MASKDLHKLIDREVETIERNLKKLDRFEPPKTITGEFNRALTCANKARKANGDAAVWLLVEARFLHEKAKEECKQWAAILDKITDALKS